MLSDADVVHLKQDIDLRLEGGGELGEEGFHWVQQTAGDPEAAVGSAEDLDAEGVCLAQDTEVDGEVGQVVSAEGPAEAELSQVVFEGDGRCFGAEPAGEEGLGNERLKLLLQVLIEPDFTDFKGGRAFDAGLIHLLEDAERRWARGRGGIEG